MSCQASSIFYKQRRRLRVRRRGSRLRPFIALFYKKMISELLLPSICRPFFSRDRLRDVVNRSVYFLECYQAFIRDLYARVYFSQWNYAYEGIHTYRWRGTFLSLSMFMSSLLHAIKDLQLVNKHGSATPLSLVACTCFSRSKIGTIQKSLSTHILQQRFFLSIEITLATCQGILSE